MRVGGLLIVLMAAAGVACSPPSADELVENVLRTRNNYEVRLTSWAPFEEGTPQARLYLDVVVVKNTEDSLTDLTVLVEQLDSAESPLSSQRVSIDVSAMDLRGLSKNFGVEVSPLQANVEGVRLILEPNPPRDAWGEFPELDRVRPRGG